MRKIFLFFCFFFALHTSFSFGQTIKPGEKLTYSGSYNMGGLMTNLAQITMETEMVKTSKSSYLHLSCRAATYSKWDSFFKIRDLYEAYVNPVNLRPNLYKRSIDEGGYTKKEKYVFKKDGKTITSTVKKKNKPEYQKTFTVGGSTQDIVSILYKLRTIDFSKLKTGQTKSFVIVFDEKEIPVTVKYMGDETVKAGNLGTKECHKIAIAAKTAVLKGKDKNLIWLTADSKKIPALIRFSIPVGTGELTLTTATGL